MFSLQKALGKDDRFFDLLEASAKEARASAQALTKFFQPPDAARSLDDFAQSRRNEKKINAEIIESMATQVMTMFEREDVEALAKALYKIPKTVAKIGERLLLDPEFLRGIDLSKPITMLERATNILLLMVGELRRGAALSKVQQDGGSRPGAFLEGSLRPARTRDRPLSRRGQRHHPDRVEEHLRRRRTATSLDVPGPTGGQNPAARPRPKRAFASVRPAA